MDVLFRQLRTKYPPHEEDSLKATRTFLGERRSQSWIRRQFSKQMNQNYESTSEGDYPTAIAAAAFAVKSLEDQPRIWHQGPDASFTQPNDIYNTDTAAHISSSGHVSKPNLDAQDKLRAETSEKLPPASLPIPSIKKKLSFAETTVIPEPALPLPAEQPEPEPIGMIPSIKKPLAPTRVFKKRQDTSHPRNRNRIDSDTPPLEQISISARKKISQNEGGAGDIDADEWERTEMSRIKDKYDKLNVTILDWESKKKRKAKTQLDKVQAESEPEPDKRRAKAVQHYRTELERIQSIAEGARSQAIENRRNEELKVREKANKIRLTGKLPATCLCC